MSQDEFTKLFRYMQQNFDAVNKRLDNTMTKDAGDHILNILDGFADRFDIDDTERVAMSVQLDRHEDWIQRTSHKLGVRYDPSASA